MIAIEKHLLGGHYKRGAHAPLLIVNHISAGSKKSVINTFSNLSNNVSSTFLNCRDGTVVQFLNFDDKPKTNGIVKSPRSSIVKQLNAAGVNINYVTISIENEDAFNDDTPGVDGQLTEAQFYNLCRLHKYIQSEVKRVFGNTIPLNSTHVLGHRDIDSVGKALCPGPNFPMARLLAELAIADSMTLEAYEERIDYIQKPSAQLVKAFAISDRIKNLSERINDPKYGAECIRKLTLFTSVEGLQTVEDVCKRVVYDLYVKAHQNADTVVKNEAVRKLILYHTVALEKGLL